MIIPSPLVIVLMLFFDCEESPIQKWMLYVVKSRVTQLVSGRWRGEAVTFGKT